MVKIFNQLLIWILKVHILTSLCYGDVWNNNQRVREKVLKGYDKKALPERDVNDTTTVTIHLYLRSLWMDDVRQILNVNSWIYMSWYDPRLKWDYKDYGGLKFTHFGDDELWKPDLTVFNNAEISEVDHYGNVHFLVEHDGHVEWIPPANMKVHCPMDLKYWPFDEHKCYIMIGSWTFNGWMVNFELYYPNKTEVHTEGFLESSADWKVLSLSQERVETIYQCCKEPYIDMIFTFHLKRYSPTFTALVVIPAVAIPLFLIIQFILPVDHPKRLWIGFICSILVVMEMIFLKFSISKVGTTSPLIVSYYGQCLILVILTIFLSAILGRLSHPQNPLLVFPPPEIVKNILTGRLATILCVQTHASKVGLSGISEDGEVLEPNNAPNYSHEWIFIAKVVDRIAFILFICIFFFSLIGYVAPIK